MFRRALQNTSNDYWRRNATNSSSFLQKWDNTVTSSYLLLGAAVFGIGFWALHNSNSKTNKMHAEQLQSETQQHKKERQL